MGRPLILVSALSAHTGALAADARCSLLLGEAGKGDPLAHPRMTLKCRAERIEGDGEAHAAVAGRFLARHPKAALYAGFADFSYFRLEPEEASLNGGFGKAYRLTRAELMSDAAVARDLETSAAGAIAHMNADHLDAIALYARHFAGIAEPLDWKMTGIDQDGFDLAAGDRVARIFFAEPLNGADALRAVLVTMARQARAQAPA